MNAKNFSNLLIVILFSIFSHFCIGQSTPLAPTGLRITSIGCGIMDFAWDDYPPELEESSFTLYVSTEGENGNYNYIETLSANVLSYKYEISHINPDNFYYYKIKAIINNFESEFSSPISAKFNCLPPANFIVSPICGGFTLAWDKLINSPHAVYEIFRSMDGINYNYSFTTGTFSMFYYDKIFDFVPNGTYYYKIRAKYSQGNGPFSNVVSAVYNCPPPNNLRITNSYCGRIEMDWDEVRDDIDVRLEVFRSKNGIDGNYEYYANSKYGFGDQGYWAENGELLLGSIYHYKVRYEGGNGFSNIISGSIDCTTPKKLQSYPIDCSINSSNNGIYIFWNYFASFNLGMKIYRSINGPDGDFVFLANWNSNEPRYFDTNVDLSTGNVYHYKIQYQGESTFSNIASNSFSMSTVKSGSWTDPTVWSCGRIPNSGDIILIDFYHNINIEDNVIGKLKNLTLRGQLNFGMNANLLF